MHDRQDLREQCRQWYYQRQYGRVISVADEVLAGSNIPGRERALWLSLKAAALSTASPLWIRPAIGCLNEALDFAQGDNELCARLLAELSAAYGEGRDPNLVRPLVPRYLRLERKHKLDKFSVLPWGARIFYNLGSCLSRPTEAREAKETFDQAIQRWHRYLETRSDPLESQWLGLALHNQADALIRLGWFADAQLVLDESGPRLPDEQWGAMKLNRRAELALAENRFPEVITLTEKALVHPTIAEDKRAQGEVLFVQAQALAALGVESEALARAQESLHLAVVSANGPLMARVQTFMRLRSQKRA